MPHERGLQHADSVVAHPHKIVDNITLSWLRSREQTSGVHGVDGTWGRTRLSIDRQP
jgi:hypothetical protein